MTTILNNVAVGGIDAIASVDIEKFSPEVMEYVIRIGLKNILQDAHASVTEKVEADEAKRKAAKTAASMKKLDALYNGVVRMAVGTRGDEVAREMRSLAEDKVKEAIRANGKKVSDYKDQFKGLVDKYLAKHEATLRATAEARLAIKPETDASDADVAEMLGL